MTDFSSRAVPCGALLVACALLAGCESKANREASQRYLAWIDSLELVRLCGETKVYRDPANGALYASGWGYQRIAADVPVEAVCAYPTS